MYCFDLDMENLDKNNKIYYARIVYFGFKIGLRTERRI